MSLKFKKILFWVFLIQSFFILGLFLYSFFYNSSNAYKSYVLGEEVILNRGQKLYIKNTNDYIEINSFINSPCPKNAKCFWSGQSVVFDIYIDGVIEKNSEKYSIQVLESDYTTYAKIIIK